MKRASLVLRVLLGPLLLALSASLGVCAASAAAFVWPDPTPSSLGYAVRTVTKTRTTLWETNVAAARDATSDSSSASSSLAESRKQALLQLLRVQEANDEVDSSVQPSRVLLDNVLADPTTKEPLFITASRTRNSSNGNRNSAMASSSTMLGGTMPRRSFGGGRRRSSRNNVQFRLSSQDPSSAASTSTAISSVDVYTGSTDSFLNLLTPTVPEDGKENDSSPFNSRLLADYVLPMIPPPIRSGLATAGFDMGKEYVPMRDLFTSPLVSYAYERGWRQGFAAAGFPGPDIEAQMAMDYFGGINKSSRQMVVVDMSCATGLFTRRLAAANVYGRVLGCDYSASMLTEARRRIDDETALSSSRLATTSTVLDLVQCDVRRIPMQSSSVDALHAGAAMHCWPDLVAAVSEIYRVLRPGGRYFATTFLSSYFGTLQRAEGGATGPSRQAFQYFGSTQQLSDLLESGGFAANNIQVEVLGNACVVIRCEK